MAGTVTILDRIKACWRLRSSKISEISRIVVPNHANISDDVTGKVLTNSEYMDNRIRTTKYTWWNFVPKNLFEQFHRWANLYFIFIVAINFVPVINAFAKEVAMIPVIAVLLVTAMKDGYEDYKRLVQDRKINSNKCDVHDSAKNKYVRREWQDVHVGDMLHLSCNEVVPADVLLLHSSDSSGVCFIETSNLDGESNLKQRETVAGFGNGNHFHPTDFTYKIECELPNNELYKFNGSIIDSSGYRTPITKENLLQRGCTLRNTDYVEAIVVYAGHDTKALLNNRGPRYKRSKLERQINRDVIWCVVLLAMLCIGGGLGHGIWMSRLGDLSKCVYIAIGIEEQNPPWQAFITFWSLLILLQVMIPLPMYVTIELVKLGQVYFIQQDLEMYYPPTDRRIECRALNITEDLGQIQYVFSDKTGTLTENRMTFQCCTIGGVDYSDCEEAKDKPETSLATDIDNDEPEEEFTVHESLRQDVAQLKFSDPKCSPEMRRVHDFFVLMAVCNTVIVAAAPHMDTTAPAQPPSEEDSESDSRSDGSMPSVAATVPPFGNKNKSFQRETSRISSHLSVDSGLGESGLCYEAESPDELALVKAALAYGIRLIRRAPGSITIWTPAEGELTITVLHILKFDAERKCMSVIVQYPGSNDVVLLCKGADSAVIGNLAMDRDTVEMSGYEEMVKKTDEQLHQYAKLGLRTLCMAKKLIPKSEYEAWLPEYSHALSALVDRDRLLTVAIAKVEKGLTLLGATGIEDSLQEGVPETIQSLRKAGMNVWVLTGDKQETAINIAYSCRLITTQDLIVINAKTNEDCEELIRKYLRKLSAIDNKSRKDVQVRKNIQKHKNKRAYALVIDGASLAFALADYPEEFLQLAEQCHSVLCCRATPLQKANVVKLCKEKLNVLTLAIGDGANDVSMIQTADIGIGISGQEGMQAVMASDFALAQFRFLNRLLLVHGHWCYDRLARTALYMFYKSAAFVFVLFWYQVHNGFSASTSVDQYYTIFHNLFYTSIPPVIVGIFDQDLPAKVLIDKPWLYRSGPARKSYQPYSYFLNVLDALYQSAMVYFVSYLAYSNSSVGMAEYGTTVITGCVVCALCTIALETRTFTWPLWMSLFVSVGLMWFSMVLTGFFSITTDPPLNPYWVFFVNLSTPLYWLSLILSTVIALLPRLFFRSFKATIDPSPSSIERQIFVDTKPSREPSLVMLESHKPIMAASLASITSHTQLHDAAARKQSMKSLRQLPRTTHIVKIPARVSASVPFLNEPRTLEELRKGPAEC